MTKKSSTHSAKEKAQREQKRIERNAQLKAYKRNAETHASAIANALANFEKPETTKRITIKDILAPLKDPLLGLRERHKRGEISYNDIVEQLKKFDVQVTANSLATYCQTELGFKPKKKKSKEQTLKESNANQMIDEIERAKEQSQSESKATEEKPSFNKFQQKICEQIKRDEKRGRYVESF